MSAIGPIESLASSPGSGQARVVGLRPVLGATGRAVPTVAAGIEGIRHMRQTQGAKDFDDSPTDDIVGTIGGQKATARPGTGSTPTGSTYRPRGAMPQPTPFSQWHEQAKQQRQRQQGYPNGNDH